MKKITKILLTFALAFSFCLPLVNVPTTATTAPISVDAATLLLGTPTGYDSADDVKYEKKTTTYKDKQYSNIANWGARNEPATFLTTPTQEYYTGNYTYDILSQKSGSSSQSNVPNSELYKALKSLMSSNTKPNSYDDNKIYLRYTDCVNDDPTYISSFYSAVQLNGYWDYPAWNREHTWPNSKGLGDKDEDDIMMIRPTAQSENSSRGNTAYGESYYDPNGNGQNLRGDCARIVLYVYTRWGNTSYMWGSGGVMESLETLLKWMQEDPVDTWEMGRNDVVQSITGTRNVFVDYPEYAWLLFGKEIPKVNTPSGIANGGTVVTPPVGGDNGGTTDPDNGGSGNNGGNSGTTTTTYTSISALRSGNTSTTYTAKGVVIAVGKVGFMFNDGTGSMYYYTKDTQPTVAVGDEVEVVGTLSEFGGQKQFDGSKSATYTKKDVDVPTYTTPANPTVWTTTELNAFTGTVGQYVQVTVNVYTEGTYINCQELSSSDNKKISLVEPTSAVLNGITLSSTPQTITVIGYTCYLSGNNTKYAYIIPVAMQLGTVAPPVGGDQGGNGDNGGTTQMTPAQIIAAAQALGTNETLSGTHTLTGVVTEIEQVDQNDVKLYMEIEGFSMYCYWLQEAGDQVEVGDTITVTGTIKNFNDIIEFDKPTLVSVEKPNQGDTTDPDNGDNGNNGDTNNPDNDDNGNNGDTTTPDNDDNNNGNTAPDNGCNIPDETPVESKGFFAKLWQSILDFFRNLFGGKKD